MIVSPARPKQIIRWFHEQDEDHEILVVFLALEQTDRMAIKDFVHDFYSYDAAMGARVGFLLCWPNAANAVGFSTGEPGAVAVFPGEACLAEVSTSDNGVARPIQDMQMFSDLNEALEDDKKKIAELISRQTSMFVTEFRGALGVDVSQLPAMCILVKGQDRCRVVQLEKNWKREIVLRWLQSLARIAERPSDNYGRSSLSLVKSVPALVAEGENLEQAIEARFKDVENALENIIRRFHGNDVDRLNAVRFLERKLTDEESLDKLFVCFSFFEQMQLKSNRGAQNLRSHFKELRTSQCKLTNILLDLEGSKTVSDLRQQRRLRSEETLDIINSLQLDGSSIVYPPAYRTTTSRLIAIVDGVNRWGDFGTKISDAVEWIKNMNVQS